MFVQLHNFGDQPAHDHLFFKSFFLYGPWVPIGTKSTYRRLLFMRQTPALAKSGVLKGMLSPARYSLCMLGTTR
jgi:hypothetical protein